MGYVSYFLPPNREQEVSNSKRRFKMWQKHEPTQKLGAFHLPGFQTSSDAHLVWSTDQRGPKLIQKSLILTSTAFGDVLSALFDFGSCTSLCSQIKSSCFSPPLQIESAPQTANLNWILAYLHTSTQKKKKILPNLGIQLLPSRRCHCFCIQVCFNYA